MTMTETSDNNKAYEEYKARTRKAEIAIANFVASAPPGFKVMELASILGKTIVPHGSDFGATFGVGRLTEFLEGNECFFLEGHCPKNVKVIKLTQKGKQLELELMPWPPKLRRDPPPSQHLIPAHHPALKPGQGLPPGAADPRYAKVGERGQSSGADPLGRPDHDAQSDVQLECDLTDYIGRMPDQSVALDRALDTHVRQAGLVPKAVSLRQWLMHRPAVFEVKGQMVSLTQQSVEYDRHLEAQFISFLQQIARPAHLSKDIGQYCKKHNIEMRAQNRLHSWFRAKHRIFKVVEREYITLKPAYANKPPPAEYLAPPGFQGQGKRSGRPSAQTNGDSRLLSLEQKIVNWVASQERVSTTEMAEYAYGYHDTLVPENWDANTFCQERTQLFLLTGVLHDQVELTDIAKGLASSTAQPASTSVSPRSTHSSVQPPQLAVRPTPNIARQATPSRPTSSPQDHSDIHHENTALKERCTRLETEVKALRKDLVAIQQHMHLPTSLSAFTLDHEAAHQPHQKIQMCVLGGHNGSAWLETVTTHKPHGKKWGHYPHLEGARSFAAADTWESNIYIAGGGDGTQWFNSVVRCDTATHAPSWVPVAPMQTERGSLAVTTLGNFIYAIGGGKPTAQFETVERYDPQTDRWTPQASLHTPRFALAAACSNNALFAVGGFDGTAYLSSVEQYDPRVGRWAQLKAEMLWARGSLGVAAVGDSIYAIGGFDAQSALNVVEVLDTRVMQWRSLQNLNAERSYGGATVIGSQVFAVGGLQADTVTYSPFIEAYDTISDTWSIPHLPSDIEPRAFAAVCSL